LRQFRRFPHLINTDGVFGKHRPKVRETLAKGVPLDLDSDAFRPGDAALTLAGHINIHFWQIDDTPTYEIMMFRSFAKSFYDWFLDASAEFGGTIP
jgi:methylglutamate dehydrogenase subunit D